MTRIRRINVSQVEGGDANNTDTEEIRPNGETAFYLDGSDGTDKLTLMMFNGTRTHRKSKVLAPGVLWGSNADSSDGNNYDTIKLIPDAQLKADGTDQWIVIDPTLPGHIHIRAGGTIDNSGADLYLGGENSYVKIPNGPNPDVIISANSSTWAFGSDGILTLPSGATKIGSLYGSDAILASTGTAFGIVSQGAGTSILQWIDDINNPTAIAGLAVNPLYASTGSVQIFTGAVGPTPQYGWTFSSTGNLTLPAGGDIKDSTGASVLGGGGVVASDRLTSSTYSVILNGSTGTVTIPNTLVSDGDSLSIASSQYSLDIGRYLRIRDGDVSSHIHIDSPNNATYDLIWGDDYTFVRVDHTGTVVIGTNDGTQREWTFETDGSLRFPNGSLQTTAYTGTNNASTIDITDTNGLTTVYYPTFIETRGAEQTVRADVNLTYRTDDNILGVGAIGFSGGNFRVVNVSTASTGASGDKEGDIAFSSGYIYYCFADFGSFPTETFTVVNVGQNTNVIKVNMAANPNYTVPQAGWYVIIGGVTMTLSAFSAPNGSDFDFLFDNASGIGLPSTVTLTSNTSYTNIWKRVAWSGDTW